jgi:hypothetical protein
MAMKGFCSLLVASAQRKRLKTLTYPQPKAQLAAGLNVFWDEAIQLGG